MKRLSDFEDREAIVLVSRIIPPIGRIVQNPAITEARRQAKAEGRPLQTADLAGLMLEHGADEILTILALLNGMDPAEYHCTAASVLLDVLTMFGDPDMQALFGLQSKTTASSGSASESTEAPEASDASSDTAAQGSGKSQKKKSSAPT